MNEIHSLLGSGQYALAEESALANAQSALILACEGATKQGALDRAEDHLRSAMTLASSSEVAIRAQIRLAGLQLRKGDLEGAARTASHVAPACSNDTASMCSLACLRGRILEAQGLWVHAAIEYDLAAVGFDTLGDAYRGGAARQNQAWAMLAADPGADVERVLSHVDTASSPVIAHVQRAMLAYRLLITCKPDAAGNAARTILNEGGPSRWAECLAAVTAGRVALLADLRVDAREFCRRAEKLLDLVATETGSTDMAPLVSSLRADLAA